MRKKNILIREGEPAYESYKLAFGLITNHSQFDNDQKWVRPTM